METSTGKPSTREQNLVIFGHVGKDYIMGRLRSCSKHVTLQLVEHHNIAEIIRDTSNPLGQLVVYLNLESINYEGYSIVLERTKHILDQLAIGQGGLTIFSVIPIEEESINTTKSKEVKEHLLLLNDAILDYCAQNYPTCYNTHSLASIIQGLERPYDKNSGFDVYKMPRHGNGDEYASNEICGTASPNTSSNSDSSKLDKLDTPQEQVEELVRAMCESSNHLFLELEADLPTYDYEDFARAIKNVKEESQRLGCVLFSAYVHGSLICIIHNWFSNSLMCLAIKTLPLTSSGYSVFLFISKYAVGLSSVCYTPLQTL